MTNRFFRLMHQLFEGTGDVGSTASGDEPERMRVAPKPNGYADMASSVGFIDLRH
jgi:hypothetical protein